jgi:hypothetical protein
MKCSAPVTITRCSITGPSEPDSVLDAAALEAARGYARRRPNEAWPHLYLAGYLVNLHL